MRSAPAPPMTWQYATQAEGMISAGCCIYPDELLEQWNKLLVGWTCEIHVCFELLMFSVVCSYMIFCVVDWHVERQLAGGQLVAGSGRACSGRAAGRRQAHPWRQISGVLARVHARGRRRVGRRPCQNWGVPDRDGPHWPWPSEGPELGPELGRAAPAWLHGSASRSPTSAPGSRQGRERHISSQM